MTQIIMQDEIGETINLTKTIRNVLPKANEIVDIQQQLKRTIYPFKMIHHIHSISDSHESPQQYIINQTMKFIPPKPTIIAHFSHPLIIYDKFNNASDEELFNYNIFSIQKLKNLRNNDYVMSGQLTVPLVKNDTLRFDSRFESGNLSMVSRVQDVYCLLLHNDVNTGGYTNWFYFSVRCSQPGTYKFAIMNYGKAGWPYNSGTGICVYYQKDKVKKWRRGCTNIQCQPNRKIYSGNHYLNNFNTLSFDFCFKNPNEEIFFSYNIPYTYTQLCTFLDSIQSKKLPYFYRKLAGRSLAGNRLEMLTIVNYEVNKLSNQDLPVIVMLGRSHSGETVSSWMIQSFIQFMVSDDVSAKILRDNFIFKIFPMVNPDGVIHGNYRCSLSGRDLNRRWTKPSKDLFPQVYYIKNQILQLSKNRSIKLILDMHGHSQKKKVFIYGCNDKLQPHRCRLFPYIMSKVSEHFQFNSCNFSMDKSKISTARITLYNTLKVTDVFTIQSSQYGTYFGHINSQIMKEVGKSIAKSLILYFRPPNAKKQTQLEKALAEGNALEQQLMDNEQLLQSGNNADSGSERDPSLENIGYDKLAKMTEKKEIRQKRASTPIPTKKNTYKKMDDDQTMFAQKPLPQGRSYSRQNNREIATQNGRRPQINRPIHTANNSRHRTSTLKDKLSETGFMSPKSPQKTQVLKMINFSLSINDQKNYIPDLISKMSNYHRNRDQVGDTSLHRNLIKPKSHSTRIPQI